VPHFHEFAIDSIDQEPDLLAGCAGKVALAVNVASECGYTPQYEGLEKLYRELRGQGLVVLGFPCNQFGAQEPGTEAEIKSFCTSKFSVTFPMSAKIDVNGANRHAVYAWLTDATHGFPGDIDWNFEKFLIGRDGRPIARYPAGTTPDDAGLLQDIANAL